MDEIQTTTLKGSITASIVGGAVLVKGKLKNALSTNGINQAVHFGKHLDKCFHIPDVCGDGSTFSYWLKKKSGPDSGFIVDSGGFYGRARGYAHVINSHGIITAYVRNSAYYYFIQASIGAPEKWVFIVQTWSSSSGVKLYVNGCMLMPSINKLSARTVAVSMTFDFVIGANSAFSMWAARWGGHRDGQLLGLGWRTHRGRGMATLCTGRRCVGNMSKYKDSVHGKRAT